MKKGDKFFVVPNGSDLILGNECIIADETELAYYADEGEVEEIVEVQVIRKLTKVSEFKEVKSFK